MSSFFDSLFKWFKHNDDEDKDIFEDQKKAYFDFYTPSDDYYQRKYISCETQTDKIDFPLSPFDTEPPPKKEIKESKHLKYGFKNPIKLDENFKFEFKFNNAEKTTSKKVKPPAFQANINLNDNNQNSEHQSIETENQINRLDKSEFQNQSGNENQQQSENQSIIENQQQSGNQSDSDNQQQSGNQSDSESQQETESQTDSGNRSGSENQTETDTNYGYEEEDYDSKTDTES